MATSQASLFLTRTKSARVPGNTSKPQRTASTQPTSAGPSVANGAAPAVTPTSTSNVSLFLRNIRLLDLDLRPDWPDINALTFTTRDATQGQKKRIQCVEWSLYQLFCLWDPEEARNKLQPFFPPLDQVQSVNLRAALLRSLELAKKNGTLGRDAVLRKTMLDECKGERLEEVLAVFSSAVLKRLAAEQLLNEPEHPPVSLDLALENRGYSGERTKLTVLILAHKSSLDRQLKRKIEARAKYTDFSELLDLKQRGIVRQREQVKSLQSVAETSAQSADDEKLAVRRTVRNNWSGNEQWMETLLSGDSTARRDGLLTTPYERVWRRVEAGRLPELEDRNSGLLHQLEGRVRAHNERLVKWQNFQKKMSSNLGGKAMKPAQRTSEKRKGIDLGFGAHENLRMGRTSPRKLPLGKPVGLAAEYAALVNGLKQELASIDKGIVIPRIARNHHLQAKPEHGSRRELTPEEETISELSELEDERPLEEAPPLSPQEAVWALPPPAVQAVVSKAREMTREERTAVPQPPTRPGRPALRSAPAPAAVRRSPSTSPTRELRHSPPPMSPPSSPERMPSSPSRSPTRRRAPPRPAIPETPEPVSPTQQMADQILASMDATSPSPVKKPRHTLSLAERTRLSMARRNSQLGTLADDEDDDELAIDPLPLRRLTVTVDPPKETDPIADADAEHGNEDLVARTRRSMAGFEAARQKAQLERRRSQRKSRQITPAVGRREGSSYFPAVDEEEGNTTLLLAEELMSGRQEDYEAVFKSRPKIKTSPVGTPVKEYE